MEINKATNPRIKKIVNPIKNCAIYFTGFVLLYITFVASMGVMNVYHKALFGFEIPIPFVSSLKNYFSEPHDSHVTDKLVPPEPSQNPKGYRWVGPFRVQDRQRDENPEYSEMMEQKYQEKKKKVEERQITVHFWQSNQK